MRKDTLMLPSEFYISRESDRKQYEDRAIEIAEISLPYMIRNSSDSASTSLKKGASQSFNGRLINNLKAKMGMSLLPPSTSSFKLKPDAIAMMQLFEGDAEANAKIAQDMSMKADVINTEIEDQQIRSAMFDMILQLIGVGSVVVEKVKKRGMLVYPLQSFTAKLDSMGEPLTICVKETLSVLPKDIAAKEEKDEYELYTMLNYDKDSDKWIMTQDIDGELVGDEKSYKDYDSLPFRYFGWTWMQGEKYHRPFAEDYYPDMEQVDVLSKLNTQGSVVAAKILILVDQQSGRTRKKDVADSDNGAIIDGRADDISAFELGKSFDFRSSNEREAVIKKELMACFLDTGSVTRDAERVTAEEIRVMAQQLESSTLAGIYSKMSLKWSKWMVEQIMSEINIKFEAVEVNILTGLDALGRSQEAQKQDAFFQRASAAGLNDWLQESELLTRWASYDGINTVNLIKTPKEVQQERKQAADAQSMQAMQDEGGKALGAEGGKAVAEQMMK